MAAADLRIDSVAAEAWCEAVQDITDKVDAILKEVAQIISDLGESDEGGTIGQKLVSAAAGYLEKFGEMVQTFISTVQQIADFIGKAVDFVSDIVDTLGTIGKILRVIF